MSASQPTSAGARPRDLARREVRELPLYAPDDAACDVDVSDNTNLWGAPPAAQRAVREATTLSRYPTLYCGDLKAALLRYVGVPGAAVITGCGSDDVIDCAMRAFGEPGDEIAYCAPTFSMIPVFARLNGLTPVPVPFAADWDVDAERLLATRAKIIYLCAPNNPTATAASRAAIEHVVERAPGVVVLDEAYAEFARETHGALAMRSDRLLVTRTFSKAFGLAGARVGYGFGAPELVALAERARGPYKVNALGERAALAALADGDDALGWVRRHAALAIENRERLIEALRAMWLAPLPSDANFVFVPTARAGELGTALVRRGVQVRTMRGLPRDLPALVESNGEGLRIGVGPWEAMQRVLDALYEVLA